MKKLVNKVLTPLMVAGALALPYGVSAQEEAEEEVFSPETSISFGASFYSDDDEDFNERWGVIPGVRFRVIRDINRNFRWEGNVGFSYKGIEQEISGITVNANLTLISLSGAFHYVSPWESGKGASYFKGGLQFTQGRIGASAEGFSDSASDNSFGIGLGGGLEFNLGDEKFYTEIGYLAGGETDFSGLEFGLGWKKVVGN